LDIPLSLKPLAIEANSHMTDEPPTDIHGRVFYLEKGFHQLSTDVKSGFADISSKFGILADRMSSSGRTDWKTVAAFAAVAVTMVGGFITVTKQPLEDRLTRVEQTASKAEVDIKSFSDVAGRTFLTVDSWRYERDKAFNQLLERNKDDESAIKTTRDEALHRDMLLADKIEHLAIESAKQSSKAP
jgi:hypothetical protein